ncbi:MAG: hypothetical protein JWO55_45 [Candidatus Saccharibacteria bacterium]|jgi:hypothetical protein|nr:hypothetical protein [Candidatus Saccharibacteria bacterium]
MLTIPLRLPVKRMAMYGSTAMLIGFTGTLTMLRQFATKDNTSSGVSVVETINRKPSQGNKAGLGVQQSESQPTASVTPLPEQSLLTVRSGNLPPQQYPRIFNATPTYNAAASGTAAANSVVSSSVGAITDDASPQPSLETPAVTTPPVLQDATPPNITLNLNTVVDDSLTP